MTETVSPAKVRQIESNLNKDQTEEEEKNESE